MKERFTDVNHAFSDACMMWIQGCSFSSPDNPAECKECTDAFLNAVLERARLYNLEIGGNSIPGPNITGRMDEIRVTRGVARYKRLPWWKKLLKRLRIK
jgi:hypothetical protein